MLLILQTGCLAVQDKGWSQACLICSELCCLLFLNHVTVSNVQDLYITTLNWGDEPREGIGGLYVARPGATGVAGAYFGKLPA